MAHRTQIETRQQAVAESRRQKVSSAENKSSSPRYLRFPVAYSLFPIP